MLLACIERNGICLLDCKIDISNKDNFVGHSDPVNLCERFIAQRIKGTPGITG